MVFQSVFTVKILTLLNNVLQIEFSVENGVINDVTTILVLHNSGRILLNTKQRKYQSIAIIYIIINLIWLPVSTHNESSSGQ
jgi:hypothetical protein